MKLSLAWIFDHIDAALGEVDIAYLVQQFNQKVAEIEHCYSVNIVKDDLLYAQVTLLTDQHVGLHIAQLQQDVKLPLIKNVYPQEWYLIKKVDKNNYRWATTLDLGGTKEVALGSVHVPSYISNIIDQLETTDYILEVDNKSITHRPDLWGHRGFAQEIAVLLDLPLKSLATFLAELRVKEIDGNVYQDTKCTITLDNNLCKRFSWIDLPAISYTPSLLWMAARLARIDSKPINALVDISNYVMFDIGQPTHLFDAAVCNTSLFEVRTARKDERLALLDGDTITLNQSDIVVADDRQPLALAGIMGGIASSVQRSTHHIFAESACFDGGMIRKSAVAHKKRTEASARFEKELDPTQTVIALQRLVQLLSEAGIYSAENVVITTLGKKIVPTILHVEHRFIESCLGIQITAQQLQHILQQLGFGVEYDQQQKLYTISVPAARATKDITRKEDVVEEVGRLYGYSNIVPVAPCLPARVANIAAIEFLHRIKDFFTLHAQMHEVAQYAFLDESFLAQLRWQPEGALQVQHPVSENWSRLVTTLIPGLLKAVSDNSARAQQLRFYECARIWSAQSQEIKEEKEVAGIFFDTTNSTTFYTVTAYLTSFIQALGLRGTYIKKETSDGWYAPYESAYVYVGEHKVGSVGKLAEVYRHVVDQGTIFIFELDIDRLYSLASTVVEQFVPIAKYQSAERDISMLVPVQVTVQQILEAIKATDTRVSDACLIDFFQKADWKEQRAITVRITLQDAHKILSKEETEELMVRVTARLISEGATIR